MTFYILPDKVSFIFDSFVIVFTGGTYREVCHFMYHRVSCSVWVDGRVTIPSHSWWKFGTGGRYREISHFVYYRVSCSVWVDGRVAVPDHTCRKFGTGSTYRGNLSLCVLPCALSGLCGWEGILFLPFMPEVWHRMHTSWVFSDVYTTVCCVRSVFVGRLTSDHMLVEHHTQWLLLLPY